MATKKTIARKGIHEGDAMRLHGRNVVVVAFGPNDTVAVRHEAGAVEVVGALMLQPMPTTAEQLQEARVELQEACDEMQALNQQMQLVSATQRRANAEIQRLQTQLLQETAKANGFEHYATGAIYTLSPTPTSPLFTLGGGSNG